MIGGKQMKKAIIDIGSHSIHLVIYHDKNKKDEKLMSKNKMVGLMNYIYDDKLNQEGQNVLIETLREFQKIIRRLDVDSAYYFATAALRNISNRHEVLRLIKTSLGIHIEVLSHQEEGMLDFYGMRTSIHIPKGLMIDIGGGSSEIVHFQGNHIIQNQSIPLGALSLYRDYVKGITPTTKELNQIYAEVKKQVQLLDTSHFSTHAIGIGGTMRTTLRVAQAILKKNQIHDTMTKEEIDYLIRQLTQNTKKSAHTILKIKPERIHTFIPGLIILKEMMTQFQIEHLTISYTGLREGYYIKRIQKNTDL